MNKSYELTCKEEIKYELLNLDNDKKEFLYLQDKDLLNEFYEDWFTTNMGGGAGPGGAGNGVTIPNDTLIDALKNLIDEFVELGYDLNFTGKRGANTLCGCRHMTPAGSLSGALNGGGNNGTNSAYPGTGDSPQNYKTLENYEKVLDWIKNCEMDANRNKINVYGKAFGELLPKLQF